MKTTALQWMAVAAAAVAISVRAAESPAGGDNPALHYYQAFLLTPELAQEDSNYLFHNEWHGQDMPERVGELLARYDDQFRILRQAVASQGPCDWGIDMSAGPATLLPHLARCKAIAQVSRLRVQWHLQNNRQTDACQDFIASFELGRNVAADGTLISTLVQISMEAIHCSIIAAEFGRFTPESLRTLAAAMDAAPPRRTVAQCLEPERRFFVDPIRNRLRALQQYPGTNSQHLAELSNVLGLAPIAGPPEESDLWKQLAAAGGDITKALQWLDELHQASVRWEQLLAVPYPEFVRTKEMLERELQNSNPLAAATMPAILRAREREFGALATLALTRAAIAYKLNGDAGLNSVADPCGEGPFAFKRFVFQGADRGFELKSAFNLGRHEAALIFVETDGPPFRVDGIHRGEPLPLIESGQ